MPRNSVIHLCSNRSRRSRARRPGLELPMDQGEQAQRLKTIAAEAFAALGNAPQIPPFSSRPQGLSVDDAYRVTPLVRQMYEASGAKPLGRKIGFTNRTIWTQYGVYAPIWGYVFDRTAYDLADVEALTLAPFSEPRIEPEIVFGLATAPSAQMDETALSSCIAWVGLGFEIVQSIFLAGNFLQQIPSRLTAYTERC